MLKYSSKIDHYIKTIIPLIILSNEYKVIGSYGRTIYITDIDITNYIQENMNFQDKLNVIIENLPNNIKLFTLTSGFDESYHVPWEIINENKITKYDYIKSINFVNELFFNQKITEKERDYCNKLLSEKPIIKDIILIEDLLYQKSKIKWNINEIKNDKKEINHQKINLNTSIIKNDHNIIHYIIEYEDDIIPIDIGIIKKNYKEQVNKEEFNKRNYLMFVKKEYYFILAYMKKYFNGKKEYKEIKYLLDDKYGHFKQILMNLFYLIQFLEYPIYDDKEFQKFYDKVMKKVELIKIDNKILKELNANNHNKIKLKELLRKLEILITNKLNNIFEDYAYKYYLMIYRQHKIKYADLVFDVKN